MDYVLQDTVLILAEKHAAHTDGEKYTHGEHFGEFSLVSKTGYRCEDVTAIEDSEVFSVHRDDFWNMLQYLELSDRKKIMLSLMSSIGDDDNYINNFATE